MLSFALAALSLPQGLAADGAQSHAAADGPADAQVLAPFIVKPRARARTAGNVDKLSGEGPALAQEDLAYKIADAVIALTTNADTIRAQSTGCNFADQYASVAAGIPTCGDYKHGNACCENPPANIGSCCDEYKSSCFAKDSTTACLVSDATLSPEAAYSLCYDGARFDGAQLVFMSELSAFDLVLTGENGVLSTTRVVANQHRSADDRSDMLTLHATDGSAVSMTPDHALFIDGALVAAADAKIGSTLTNAKGESVAIKRITKADGAAVINPVTASGTILASDTGAPIVAASHPYRMAQHVVDAPALRAVINAALFLAGDCSSVGAGLSSALLKIAAALAISGFSAMVVRRSSK